MVGDEAKLGTVCGKRRAKINDNSQAQSGKRSKRQQHKSLQSTSADGGLNFRQWNFYAATSSLFRSWILPDKDAVTG